MSFFTTPGERREVIFGLANTPVAAAGRVHRSSHTHV